MEYRENNKKVREESREQKACDIFNSMMLGSKGHLFSCLHENR